MYKNKCICSCMVFLLGFILTQSPKLYAFDTLDDLVSRAIAQNLDVATAEIKVRNSAAKIAAEPAWRSSYLGMSASTSGSFNTETTTGGDPNATTGAAAGTTFSGNLSVPLTYWFSLGASGTIKSDGSLSSSISATVTPFTQSYSKEDIDYRSSLQSYRSTLHTAVLQFRALVRSLFVSKAEVTYKEALVHAATAQYEQTQVLSTQGAVSQSEVLDALVSLTQARMDYETAVATYQKIHQSIAQSLGLSDAELPDIENLIRTEPAISESLLADIMEGSTYVAMNDTYVRAVLDAESSKIDVRTAQPKPDINLKGELSPTAKTWSASASVKLPLDLLFWEEAQLAKEMDEVKQKQVQLASQTALQEYEQKVKELSRLFESWKKTATAYESANIVYNQIETLSSFGQKSKIDILSGQADLLCAAWQLASAEKTFRDALDALSVRFTYTEAR